MKYNYEYFSSPETLKMALNSFNYLDDKEIISINYKPTADIWVLFYKEI